MKGQAEMTNHDDLGRLKAEIDRLRSKLITAELERHNAEVEADRLRTHVAEVREAVQKYKPIGEIRAILVKFEGVPTMSEEADLARQIEALIAKIVSGKATDQDLMLYEMLTRRRVDLMQPVRNPTVKE